MDIKLLLLLNCVIVANCQSTSSKRNDAAYECEAPMDTESEMESIRQLLMNLQQAAVRNAKEIGEIRQILLQQQTGNETHTISVSAMYIAYVPLIFKSQLDRKVSR